MQITTAMVIISEVYLFGKEHLSIFQRNGFFFLKSFEDTSPFHGATDTPVFYFW